MPAMLMDHVVDPATEILKRLGNLEAYRVMFGRLLIATYIRPEKTKSGIFLGDKTRDEDEWQGKAGLVVKKGALAYLDTEDVKFHGEKVDVGDWVAVRPSDGIAISINGVKCRLVQDAHVLMKVPSPDTAW